jgi:ATP-dependent Lon protease
MTDPLTLLQQEIAELKQKVSAVTLPDELKRKVDKDIVALERSVELGSYDEKYEKVSRYINWMTQVPWNEEAPDNFDLQHAKEVFEKHHYGLQPVKDRFLEYLAVLNLKKKNQDYDDFRAPVLLLVGLVGTGKTTFAFSLAEAMGRPIIRVPFGGMASAKELRGSSRLHLEAEPGRIVKGLCQAKVRNPIILLDEIDRVNDDTRTDIMGVLVELLDPAQNHAFVDTYVDYPVNLSHAIFIATANNTGGIATAVMDRMEQIVMPAYTDQEKIVIARQYILPQLIDQAGLLPGQLKIADELWPTMTRPLGYDAGIRSLQRNLSAVVRKAARIIVEKNFPEVIVTPENSKIFLPTY